MAEDKTKIEEIEYAEKFQELILYNDDIELGESFKNIIKNSLKTELLKVVISIGSVPIKIESVEVYNEEYLLKNF